jgi:hypothetical protein
MDNRYILLPIILLLLTYITTYTVREKFNISFIDVSSYDAGNPNSFSLDTLNTDVPKLNEFSKINVNNYSFSNNTNNKDMLSHLYSYIDNLNTVIIKQKTFLNNFYGNTYFPIYRDKISKSPGGGGGVADIKPISGHALNLSNKYVVPTVKAKDSSAGNNSCIPLK